MAFVSEQTDARREDILYADVEARTDEKTGHFEIFITGQLARPMNPS